MWYHLSPPDYGLLKREPAQFKLIKVNVAKPEHNLWIKFQSSIVFVEDNITDL